MTRRNTIIGMGVVAAGAGLIGGSGAFDAVEADRSFEVEVAGDASGLLGLAVENDTIAGTEEGGAGGNDVIFFRLNEDATASDAPALNDDAVTGFLNVFTITNNGSQTVQVTVDTGAAEGVTFEVAEDREDNGNVVNGDVDLGDGGVDLEPGDTVSVDIHIDTTTGGGYVEPQGDPYQMTITARSADAQ